MVQIFVGEIIVFSLSFLLLMLGTSVNWCTTQNDAINAQN